MTSSHSKVVRIDQKTEQKVLSRAQKQFNTLIKKIEAQKKLLLEWQETIPRYRHRVGSEYEALMDTYNQHRVELVYLFDKAHDDKVFKKTDKKKLQHLIIELVTELIHAHGKKELKQIYNKHSDTDFDTDSQEQNEVIGDLMKSMLKEMLDIEVDDDVDVSSPEKMQAVLREKMLQQQEEMAQQQRLAEEKRSKRKKTPKQLEKEARLKEEEQNVSKSIQEVFRKLAGALHPDREQDEVERERKTKIMQQVNAAYAKKDLLRLLELQLEFEHINQAQLNNIAEERLKYFNKILQEQFSELEQEIAQIEGSFKMQMNKPPFLNLSPQQVLHELEADIKSLSRDISRLKTDLQGFSSPQTLKLWLKDYRIPKQSEMDAFDDLFF